MCGIFTNIFIIVEKSVGTTSSLYGGFTMNTLTKRFFALLVTLVMLFSFAETAFAADDNNSVSGPKAVEIILEGETGESTFSKNFQLSSPKYLTMMIICKNTNCMVNVVGEAFETKTFPAGTDGSYTIYCSSSADGKFPAGDYFCYITVDDPEATFAFYLLATDSPYN